MDLLQIILLIASAVIIAFYIVLTAFYVLLCIASIYETWIWSHGKHLIVEKVLLDPLVMPPVSILVPAHNEEETIVEAVRSLLALRYAGLEVIVINDGSTDDTLDKLIVSFSLRKADLVYKPVLSTNALHGTYLSAQHERLLVIDKTAGGKSDALNAGLNLCHTPWVCCVDADSILEDDALLQLMCPAIEDDTVVAAGGIVRIANGCRISSGRVLTAALATARLPVFQVVEYLRGFLQGRLGWSRLNGLLIISGAFGAFRTDVLRAVGGYSTSIAAEDMEIVLRIHKYFRERSEQYKVVFVPNAICWTEVPATIATLRRQRRRWQRGLAQVLALHRNLFLRSRLGVVGLLALPYFTLELLAPIVELLGFALVPLAWGFGRLSHAYLFLYLMFSIFLGISFTLCAVAVEEFAFKRYSSWHDLLRLLLYAVIEGVGYHQLVLWWRLEGTYEYFRRSRQWGNQVRVGFRRRRARAHPGNI